MNTDRLIESMPYSEALSEAQIDRESCIIRNIMVARHRSKNNRLYTDKALDGIARCSEGLNVYLNHESESEFQDHGVRDIKNLSAMLVNARRVGKEVRADMKVLDIPTSRDLIFTIAENKPAGVGMSIDSPVGGFSLSRGKNGEEDVVEDITALNSVDIVSSAGMAQSLFESSIKNEDERKVNTVEELKSVNELKEKHPGFVAELLLPVEHECDEALKERDAAVKERDKLKETLLAIKTKADRREEIVKQLTEAKSDLPVAAIDMLCVVDNDIARKGLLDTLIKKVKKSDDEKENVSYPEAGEGSLSEAKDKKYWAELGL